MKSKYIVTIILLFLLTGLGLAQQFNTDNYLTMPHGTSTICLTVGERNATFINSFALIQNWEFFAQATLYWPNESQQIPQHFTTNVYAKYMPYENEEKTAGVGVFLGYGVSPFYYDQTELLARHSNFWTAVAVTIPFLDNTFSWDIMPGGMVDFDYANNKKTAWGFTYSTRLAVYKIIPQSAIVGEIYGTAGELSSEPEYKIGIRWEPNNTVIPAISYSSAVNGTPGAGFEIGVVIFSPPFLKL